MKAGPAFKAGLTQGLTVVAVNGEQFDGDKLKAAGVSSVEIERPGNKLRFIIRTARPGIVIGRKGAVLRARERRFVLAHALSPLFTGSSPTPSASGVGPGTDWPTPR